MQKQALRAISAEARRVERAHAAAIREASAREKLAAAQRVQASQEEAAARNAELRLRLEALDGVLSSSLVRPTFRFADLKVTPTAPPFEPGELAHQPRPPELASFLPAAPKGFTALLPGRKRKHAERVRAAEDAFQEARLQYEQLESKREAALVAARAEYEQKIAELNETARQQHAEIDELERSYEAGDPEAVIQYFTAVLAAMSTTLPYHPVKEPRVAFSADSRQLVIELELPPFEAVPEEREFRYVKARDQITGAPMPAPERRRRYASLIAQLTLRTLHETFQADQHDVIETIIFNGHVQTVDKRTGQRIRPCLVTVRTTTDQFGALNLEQVDPAECLKGLNASVSRSPAELVPVRPVMEFDMADPRFVTKEDVLGTLDARPNLMELTFKEFEALITNLFERMGLETRLTQPSRDGGVDCVAYDTRPIFGGKVVIQAKRYKNTVGVSAVRDLFGTMQNEGATKGILVTTSGYGKASQEFANGKPLELIDGGNLIYLLREHAAIDAKIEAPEDWVEPDPDQ